MTRALVVALALYAAPARADCQCSVEAVIVDGVPVCPAGAIVTCDAPRFEKIMATLALAEHDRDVALAANVRLAEELRVRITPVEVEVWPWAAGGVLVGIVLGVVLAR